MNKIILTDADETILRCSIPLERFFSERLSTSPTSNVINVREAYGIGEDVAFDLIHDFWRSDIMKSMDPEPCAAEVLPRLYSQGWRFVAITACADEPSIRENRMANLKAAFGFDWEDVHCTGYHSITPDGRNKKSEYLARYEPAIWVEDNYQNALAGALLGHKSFLIHRDHNEDTEEHALVSRVRTWNEIEEYIKEHNL